MTLHEGRYSSIFDVLTLHENLKLCSQLLNVKTVNFNCATVCLRLANSTTHPRNRGSTVNPNVHNVLWMVFAIYGAEAFLKQVFLHLLTRSMIRFYDSNVLPICAPPVFTRILTFLLWWKCSKQALLCINMRRTENGASATLTPVET